MYGPHSTEKDVHFKQFLSPRTLFILDLGSHSCIPVIHTHQD